MISFCGGELGIRTLDTVPRIHDFQSCAFDQLSQLSKRNVYYIITILRMQALF